MTSVEQALLQCRYMAAAYPGLSAEESCSNHRHEPRVFALAEALAKVCQPDVTDEKVGWFVDDADAIVDDFDPTPSEWKLTGPELSDRIGVTQELAINDRAYVIPDSEWEPAPPVALATWLRWNEEDDQ